MEAGRIKYRYSHNDAFFLLFFEWMRKKIPEYIWREIVGAVKKYISLREAFASNCFDVGTYSEMTAASLPVASISVQHNTVAGLGNCHASLFLY